jgi:hypothetical protein
MVEDRAELFCHKLSSLFFVKGEEEFRSLPWSARRSYESPQVEKDVIEFGS